MCSLHSTMLDVMHNLYIMIDEFMLNHCPASVETTETVEMYFNSKSKTD